PETRGRPKPKADASPPRVPYADAEIADGTKQLLDGLGPKKFAQWMRAQKRVLVTDTTMRDGHQSLLATRVRTFDIAGNCRRLRTRAAAVAIAGMLGRGDLRRCHEVPHGGPVGAAGQGARSRAERVAADAASWRQWRWLHQLSGQCGALLRQAGGCKR